MDKDIYLLAHVGDDYFYEVTNTRITAPVKGYGLDRMQRQKKRMEELGDDDLVIFKLVEVTEGDA